MNAVEDYSKSDNEIRTSGCYHMQFSVSYDYPVYFTKDLFHPENDLLTSVIQRKNENRRHRLKVFIDDGVVSATPGIIDRIETHIGSHPEVMKMEGPVERIPGGEQAKQSWNLARQTMMSMAEARLCRQSFVLAVGGGSMLDMVGLAAALVHRGLRIIRIPTTVLAQNDAGIGVKNGINERGIKNFAGTFAPPYAVLNDFLFLRTVPDKYWIGGIAEAFKVAIIKDRDFFEYLDRHAERLKRKEESSVEEAVKRCAVLHLRHIASGGDPFEFGSARPLDFGHWSAHRLESLSQYELGHGQAVSIGIALDSYYACQKGLLSEEERDSIISSLKRTGLPIWSDLLELRNKGGRLEILQGLDDFQEHLGGRLTVTLPNRIGRKVETHEMDPSIIEAGIAFLKQRLIAISHG